MTEPMPKNQRQTPRFDRHIGIDYSGAKTPTSRLKGLQVFVASAGNLPGRVHAEPDHLT